MLMNNNPFLLFGQTELARHSKNEAALFKTLSLISVNVCLETKSERAAHELAKFIA